MRYLLSSRHLILARVSVIRAVTVAGGFFLVCRFFSPMVVPVAIYSHHLLFFYHLQKDLASGGGAAAVAWKRRWLLATVSAGPEAQSTKSVPLRSHPSSQSIQQIICQGLTQY